MLSEFSNIKESFDCVMMLTWSDWFTEPISNRYHYATRLAKKIPVVFVQPDLNEEIYRYEDTKIENIVVLHVYNIYDNKQNSLLNKALKEKGYIHPLLWVYNTQFADYINRICTSLKVYHATEDYYSMITTDDLSTKILKNNIKKSLLSIDLLVAVSENVLKSYQENGGYKGKNIVLTNGCDFDFWGLKQYEIDKIVNSVKRKVVFYQGGINNRLDYKLLKQLISKMNDWEFWFCGRSDQNIDDWQKLLSYKNVKYFGEMNIKDVRKIALKATVAIMPFVQTKMIENSLPLKAFEYLSCGLPVISVPILALEQYNNLFYFAKNINEFKKGIKMVSASRYDEDSINNRILAAKKKDYNNSFSLLMNNLQEISNEKKDIKSQCRRNVLILYDKRSIHVLTIKEHLESFANYSVNNIFFENACNGSECTCNLSNFDVIVIHYSVRLSLKNHISESYANELKEFSGIKVLYIQDEYENTEQARQWIETLGINIVFTVVPQKYIDVVYQKSRFPYVKFIPTLTGFVSKRLKTSEKLKPISERKTIIGYRGRPLPYWYGNLGQEKKLIGQKMRKICEDRGIPCDIEWEEEKRIYGNGWVDFLESCKATLGTESGSNVFDDYGTIRANIEKELEERPNVSYDEIFKDYLSEHEGKVIMNQISPKMFESISLKTALILYEGSYSNILIPEKHYIELKKDYSNIEEVLRKVNDDNYLQALVDRAYEDILESGRYSYESFVKSFDEAILDAPVRDLLESGIPIKEVVVKEIQIQIKESDSLWKCLRAKLKKNNKLKKLVKGGRAFLVTLKNEIKRVGAKIKRVGTKIKRVGTKIIQKLKGILKKYPPLFSLAKEIKNKLYTERK
ncbi:MAG: glycosyltransferase [Deltaproteobacteria bacterium]